MPLLPVQAYVATTLLLLFLAASHSAASFTCAAPSTCKSAMGYIVPNATTYPELLSRFNTSTLQDLLDANNLTSSTAAIPADTTVNIPFACRCAGNGVGRSDGNPVYTVQQGDILDSISRYAFGGFVTYQEVADANGLPDANDISPEQKLWIPLPCSCDKVDGSDVMHFAYSVGEDENTLRIARKYQVPESTLLKVNNMSLRDGNKLAMGQILDVPLPSGKVPDTGAPANQRKQGPEAGTQAQPKSVPSVTKKGGTIHVPLMIGGAFLLIVVIWFSVACIKYKVQGKSYVKGAEDFGKRFEYRELAVATDNFSKSRVLGQGAFGIVYEGNLMGHKVAVKKIKGSNGETSDFYAELTTISATSHKNLVRLEGWCSRNRSNLINFMCWCRQKQSVELFLVYELATNGNLEAHLYNKEHVLPWATRYNIVKNIGSALRYLHHECHDFILHRDIKPGNILLDKQFNAKLADFGLSRIAHYKNEVVLTTANEILADDVNANVAVLTTANGTVAYMDPKCMKKGIVNVNFRSDVYSFGIVLLEIACTGKSRAQVWDLYKHNPGNMAIAADARLKRDFDVSQMQNVAVLGLWCSFPDDAKRPTLKQAMEVLEHDATLPNLIEYEGNMAIHGGVDGTCYAAASLVNGGPSAHPQTPSTSRRHNKIWQRSRAVLSYVKLSLTRAKPIQ